MQRVQTLLSSISLRMSRPRAVGEAIESIASSRECRQQAPTPLSFRVPTQGGSGQRITRSRRKGSPMHDLVHPTRRCDGGDGDLLVHDRRKELPHVESLIPQPLIGSGTLSA